MITPAYVRAMAEHNAEMNCRLYTARTGSATPSGRDRGAFILSLRGLVRIMRRSQEG